MSDHAAICRGIADVFTGKFNLSVPSDQTDLIGDGILDSLMFVDFLVHLEQRFDVTIVLEEIEFDNFRTVSAIAEFIHRRLDVDGRMRA